MRASSRRAIPETSDWRPPMAKPKPRTEADYIRDMKANDRTDAEILIVAGATRWEPQKAEVRAILKGGGK